ncbi:unnamed protein product [Gadus morhua 'NCC']
MNTKCLAPGVTAETTLRRRANVTGLVFSIVTWGVEGLFLGTICSVLDGAAVKGKNEAVLRLYCFTVTSATVTFSTTTTPSDIAHDLHHLTSLHPPDVAPPSRCSSTLQMLLHPPDVAPPSRCCSTLQMQLRLPPPSRLSSASLHPPDLAPPPSALQM